MSHHQLVPNSEHRIRTAFEDFILSRIAVRLSPRTVEFYEETAGSIVNWLMASGLDGFSGMPVRAYLSRLAERSVSDATLHKFARGIKAFARFCHREGYIPEPASFDMPRVSEKTLPVLSADELKRCIASCRRHRDRALPASCLENRVSVIVLNGSAEGQQGPSRGDTNHNARCLASLPPPDSK